MYDAFGDGWNGGTYTLTDDAGNTVATGGLLSGAAGTDALCLVTGCYDLTVGGGSWDSEITWDMTDAGGAVISAGVAGATNYISVGGATCGLSGCTDPTADNYDANATIDDGSCTYPASSSPSLINDCDDFVPGPNATWTHVLIATTIADGAASQAAQTFTMNVTSLPAGGANYRVVKTVANGNWFNGNAQALTLGPNTVTVAAVSFDRAVKFQFSSGDVEFDALTLNGVVSSCNDIAVSGCTDPTADNYDANATVDDGSCTYTISGCTDPAADNYDPNATVDDGSCTYPSTCTDYTITVGGGTYQTEVSWTISDSQGNVVASGGAPYTQVVCLEDDCYTVNMTDSWGDGWNGNVLTVSTSVGSFASDGLALGSVGSFTFCTPPAGCTDATANNYDPVAVSDDGSCAYACAVAYCSDFETGVGNWTNNGWTWDSGGTTSSATGPTTGANGSTYYMYFETSGQTVGTTVSMTSECMDISGLTAPALSFYNHMYGATMGTLSIDVSPDSGTTWIEEWTLSGDQGDQWYEGIVDLSAYTSNISVRVQAETGTSFTSDICIDLLRFMEAPAFGCTNPLAANYDSTATFDDGSCYYGCIETDTSESFESGLGITWQMDPNNDIDWTNRFGGTSSPQTGPSGAFDGSYYMYTEASGNGNGYPNMEAIMFVECIDPAQWSQLSLVFAYHMYGATMGTLSIDVSPDSGTTWIEEWTLSGDQGDQWYQTFVDLSAYTNDIAVRVQAETGPSYESDIAVDLLQFMELPSVGCTNPLADNYDSTAVIDDGSCYFSNCTQLTLNMYDSWGDGWNGNDFVMTSSNGTTFFTTTLSSGSFGTSSVCVPYDCYTITCNGGSWQGEVSWDLVDSNGIVLLSGGAPYTGSLCLPVILGCTNPLADNFDSTATIDDGSCFYGCIEVDTAESFENGQGLTWMLDPNNTVDWTNRTGGTPSFNTGPSGAFDGSYYMYTAVSYTHLTLPTNREV